MISVKMNRTVFTRPFAIVSTLSLTQQNVQLTVDTYAATTPLTVLNVRNGCACGCVLVSTATMFFSIRGFGLMHWPSQPFAYGLVWECADMIVERCRTNTGCVHSECISLTVVKRVALQRRLKHTEWKLGSARGTTATKHSFTISCWKISA